MWVTHLDNTKTCFSHCPKKLLPQRKLCFNGLIHISPSLQPLQDAVHSLGVGNDQVPRYQKRPQKDAPVGHPRGLSCTSPDRVERTVCGGPRSDTGSNQPRWSHALKELGARRIRVVPKPNHNGSRVYSRLDTIVLPSRESS